MSINGSTETSRGQRPDLKPPGAKLPADSSPNRGAGPRMVLLAIILLVFAAVIVFFVLPTFLDNDQSNSIVSSTGTEAAAGPSVPEKKSVTDSSDKSQTELSAAGSAATVKLETFLALKVQAEAENVSLWAENTYREILQAEARGDEAFTEKNYPQAEQAYDQAGTELKTLLAAKTEMFDEFLQDGYRYLSDKKSEKALHSFNRSLAIEPDNPDALTGAERARNLDSVLALYDRALADQQSGDFAAAEKRLKELQQLDYSFIPARNLLEAVQKSIEEQHFTEQMSHFYAELESGNLEDARRVLASINQSHGEHPELIQAESILAAKEETVLVGSLKKRAETLSSNEQWQEALTTYKQILTIAPNALFAVNGRKLANTRVELDRALQGTLTNPGRLQEEPQLEAAQRLLDYAQQFTPASNRLKNQTDQLASLIARASAPVPVIIRSDNMTDIVIYRVGKMGSFYTRQILLKPGSYTVVGSRRGFRDLRTTLEVDPEKAENQLYIACQESI